MSTLLFRPNTPVSAGGHPVWTVDLHPRVPARMGVDLLNGGYIDLPIINLCGCGVWGHYGCAFIAPKPQALVLALGKLAKLFVPGARLTFVMRLPDNPDATLVVTDDDTADVESALRRLRTPPPSPRSNGDSDAE